MKIEQDTQLYLGNDEYEKDNRLMMMQYCNRIHELINEYGIDVSDLKVLELGLGHGFTVKYFDKIFKDYTIIDGDELLVEQFKNGNACNAKFIIEFFENYSTNDMFDVIIMGFVLEHVDNVDVIIEKYKAFLSPGGRIFITVPNALTLNRRVGYEAGLLSDMYELSEHDYRCGHKRYFDKELLKSICEKHGLNVNRMEGLYLKPLTSKQMLALNLSDGIYDAFCRVAMNYPELSLGILVECTVD